VGGRILLLTELVCVQPLAELRAPARRYRSANFRALAGSICSVC
jgi:hypothetical protein